MSQKPTIGRTVHYFPTQGEIDAWQKHHEVFQRHLNPIIEGQPVMAFVVSVHSDDCVNLRVLLDGGCEDFMPWVTSRMRVTGGDGETVIGKWDWPPRV